MAEIIRAALANIRSGSVREVATSEHERRVVLAGIVAPMELALEPMQ